MARSVFVNHKIRELSQTVLHQVVDAVVCRTCTLSAATTRVNLIDFIQMMYLLCSPEFSKAPLNFADETCSYHWYSEPRLSDWLSHSKPVRVWRTAWGRISGHSSDWIAPFPAPAAPPPPAPPPPHPPIRLSARTASERASEQERERGGGGKIKYKINKIIIIKVSIWIYLTASPCYTTNTYMKHE